MRQKTLKVVVTFDTTNGAQAIESHGRKGEVPGRMIPIPSDISAGCGLAWCAPLEEKEALLHALAKLELEYAAVHEVYLY